MGYEARANQTRKYNPEELVRSVARKYWTTGCPMAESILTKIAGRMSKRDVEKMLVWVSEEQQTLEAAGIFPHPDTQVNDERGVTERDGRYYVPVTREELEGLAALSPETRKRLGLPMELAESRIPTKRGER